MPHKIDRKEIIIEQDEILFPNGYFFRQSSVNRTKRIESRDISEINLNTGPPSFVYNHKEIIFLKYELKEQIEKFADRHAIPIIDRFDIWEHINRPFLDTEFEKVEKEASIKLLAENGISRAELKRIRRKVAKTMFLNYFFGAWGYLGLFDYLNWTFLTKKKYWWAMKIGLRNYQMNQNQ